MDKVEIDEFVSLLDEVDTRVQPQSRNSESKLRSGSRGVTFYAGGLSPALQKERVGRE